MIARRPVRVPTVLMALLVALSLASPAGAAPLVLAPPGSGAGYSVRLSTGPDGRALVSWSGRGLGGFVAERTPSGRLLPVEHVLPGSRVFDPPFVFPDGSGAALIVNAGQANYSPGADLFDLRRPPGADVFGAPASILHARYLSTVTAASDARGDIAVIARDNTNATVLLTARAGGPFGKPVSLTTGRPRGFPSVGVGAGGRMVVVYGFDKHVVVRRGTIGSPLGPARAIGPLSGFPEFSAALDDRGTATIAFMRFGPYRRPSQRSGPYVPNVAVVAARARTGQPFGALQAFERGADGGPLALAASGSTTAIAWGRGYPVGGIRVAVTNDSGGFGHPQSAGAAPIRSGRRGITSTPYGARLAVDAAGDVLLGYSYGTRSTQTAERLAGTPRFAPPIVVSSLGHGGNPAVAVLPDRTPVVAFTDNDAVYLGDPAADSPVSLVAPRVTMTPLDPAELRRTLTVSTRVQCSQTCYLTARARITTGLPRNGEVRQVRSGSSVRGRVLRGGETVTLTFTSKPTAKAALDASGHAKAAVSVTVANASGATTTTSDRIEFGCREVTADCPRAPQV